jgi:hypothetical protein
MENSKRNRRKLQPGFCRRSDGLIVEEEFKDSPRRLFAVPPISVASIMLEKLLTGNYNFKNWAFTVGFWVGGLCYKSNIEVRLAFEKFQLCRCEGELKIYELQMSFVAKDYPVVAKWLRVEDEVVTLYGHLVDPDNYINLYTERKHTESVLDYGKEKTE